jgi:hypothetical protein
MALGMGVAVGTWVVMAVCAGVLLTSWSRQSGGYVVLGWRGRDRVMTSLLVTIVILAVSVAMFWPSVVTVTVAVGAILIGLVPVGWRWRRNRGYSDPRAGRSRTQRWTDAGRLIYWVGFIATITLLSGDEDQYSTSYYAVTVAFCGFATIVVVALLLRRERCPAPTLSATSVPGWYTDLCFDGRRFWNGSGWVDAPGRSRKYPMVALYWLVWLLPLAVFGLLAWQEQAALALLTASLTAGILLGGGLVLSLHPLPRSPREDVPPVLPPLQPAFAGWFPSPAQAGGSGVPQLRWWDGAAWTDWTYSADRI